MNANDIQQYRTRLYHDLFSGIIPERIPVNDGLAAEWMIQNAQMDLLTTQFEYTPELLIEILEKAVGMSRGDNFNCGYARNPVALMFQGSKHYVISNTGFIQHPEVSVMREDEYDLFIQNPHEFIVDVAAPRKCKAYDATPAEVAFAFARQYMANREFNAIFAQANAFIREKYGFFAPPAGSEGSSSPPFDYLADQFRGFKDISYDIKRQPQKVIDACEALMPLQINRQKTAKVDILGSSRTMTHMAVFLNNKDFEKFYWPTYFKLCNIAAERGQRMYLFCEGDWTRFTDYLQDLPAGARFWIEYGDARKYKDTLGEKHILSGLYPLTLLKNGTRQQCVDKAKELVDTLAPGGNYMFDFDKHALSIGDINPENYTAVQEYVLENGKYDNAGQRCNHYEFEKTFTKHLHEYPQLKSKYILTFDEFKDMWPPADERVEPLMKAQYEKYIAMVPPLLG